ncbi:MAG: hypothetical protein K9M15_02910 [Candidatus Marinimicrobia bacterium]|nr:hypothetical protein [Candidatus Neomarinimicrobiota bacterium]
MAKCEESCNKIAQILRADKDTLVRVEEVLTEIVGHNNVFDKIIEDNNKMIKDRLAIMNISSDYSHDIYKALLDKIQEDDKNLFEELGCPVCTTIGSCKPLLDKARELSGVGDGFFLKVDVAKKLLEKVPPKNIIKILGYSNVQELIEKEDIFEVFSALRFVEDGDWLNKDFFAQYKDLTPDDFEKREIKMIVLSERWKNVAEEFLKKKYHNISHLKELGVIFVLPAVLGIKGETLRTLALVLHYSHEISFYSKLFRKYKKEGDGFAKKIISSLRGDVLDKRFDEKDLGKKWMIVQQYLAKHDENDWRLLEPHVNPESIHWRKAESDISKLGKCGKGSCTDFGFWKDLDCVGDFYPTTSGIDVLVSFNLVDTIMSLVKKKEMIKYLYHHQECLWNKIFAGFLGEEKMEQMIIDNFEKGYIEL